MVQILERPASFTNQLVEGGSQLIKNYEGYKAKKQDEEISKKLDDPNLSPVQRVSLMAKLSPEKAKIYESAYSTVMGAAKEGKSVNQPFSPEGALNYLNSFENPGANQQTQNPMGGAAPGANPAAPDQGFMETAKNWVMDKVQKGQISPEAAQELESLVPNANPQAQAAPGGQAPQGMQPQSQAQQPFRPSDLSEEQLSILAGNPSYANFAKAETERRKLGYERSEKEQKAAADKAEKELDIANKRFTSEQNLVMADEIEKLLPQTAWYATFVPQGSGGVDLFGRKRAEDIAEFDSLGSILADRAYVNMNNGKITNQALLLTQEKWKVNHNLSTPENKGRLKALRLALALPPDASDKDIYRIDNERKKTTKEEAQKEKKAAAKNPGSGQPLGLIW